jgi:hypothetical protein
MENRDPSNVHVPINGETLLAAVFSISELKALIAFVVWMLR